MKEVFKSKVMICFFISVLAVLFIDAHFNTQNDTQKNVVATNNDKSTVNQIN